MSESKSIAEEEEAERGNNDNSLNKRKQLKDDLLEDPSHSRIRAQMLLRPLLPDPGHPLLAHLRPLPCLLIPFTSQSNSIYIVSCLLLPITTWKIFGQYYFQLLVRYTKPMSWSDSPWHFPWTYCHTKAPRSSQRATILGAGLKETARVIREEEED